MKKKSNFNFSKVSTYTCFMYWWFRV